MDRHQSLDDLNQATKLSQTGNTNANAFAVLRQFARRRSYVERCDLCSSEVGPEHQHLVEPATRKMLCSCLACAILFSSKADTRYRRVPDRICFLKYFQLTDGQWESLTLPINLAFFFYSSAAGKVVALYPSPAGATESLLPLDAWEEIVGSNPILREMEPDTEALLVNRVRQEAEYYLLPIDQCYRLVGLIRSQWRGLSGGTELWAEIDKYFAALKQRASGFSEVASA